MDIGRLVARMMRFYGLTDEAVLAMPLSRMLLLYEQITQLELEEEMRQLVTIHTGDARARLTTLQEQRDARRSAHRPGESTSPRIEQRLSSGIAAVTDAAPLHGELERRRASDERRRAAWGDRQRGESPMLLHASAPETEKSPVSGASV